MRLAHNMNPNMDLTQNEVAIVVKLQVWQVATTLEAEVKVLDSLSNVEARAHLCSMLSTQRSTCTLASWLCAFGYETAS